MATKCLVAILAVLFTAPEYSGYPFLGGIHPYSEEAYYNDRRRSPSTFPNRDDDTFAEKLGVCRKVFTHDYFQAQKVEIVDPNDEEVYAELKQSNFCEKFQIDNTTLFNNSYVQRSIVTRVKVLENFVIVSEQEHFVKELLMTCIVRYTEKPHHIQPVFLSQIDDDDDRYIFVYNLQKEIVLLAKAEFKY